MADVSKINSTLQNVNRQLHRVTEDWILNADNERRFHHRADEHKIDELLELMVTNSIIFGDDCEDSWDDPWTDQ